MHSRARSHCISSIPKWINFPMRSIFPISSPVLYRIHGGGYTSRDCRTFADKVQPANDVKYTAAASSIPTSKVKSEFPNALGITGSSALKSIHKALGNASSSYTVHGAVEVMFKECAKHAAYKTPLIDTDKEIPTTEDGEELGVADEGALWYNEFSLPVTFSTWSQVTMLHMYLLIARIRNTSSDQVKLWQQNLQDQFFFAAEERMVINHNMQAGSVRSKYLKDLYVQWRGLTAAYDEGLARGDAILAGAIWRNIFKAQENVDVRHLAQIVSYMRHSLQSLDALLFVSNLVNYKFGSISSEKSAVMAPSMTMKLPFDKVA